MKICFLGNSHLIATRDAWEQGEWNGVTATFMTAPGNRLSELAVANGRLYATGDLERRMLELTGIAEVTVDEFDAFAIVGLQFALNRCMRLFIHHRPWRDGFQLPPEARFLVSRDCMLAATRGFLQGTTAMSVASLVRSATSAPLFIMAQGGLSERGLDFESKGGELLRSILADSAQIREVFDEACATLAADMEIIAPPRTTVAHSLFTKREYDCWDGGLDGAPLQARLSHTNAEYGKLALGELLNRLASSAPPTVHR